MIGILAACLLVKGIFWSQKTSGWVPKKNPRIQFNLLTRAEVFKLESVYLFYLIFEGSTVLFDHLFDPKSRLYFTLLTSVIFDILILLIIPTVIMYRSMANYACLWSGRKLGLKKSEFIIIRGPIEPRRYITSTIPKAKRRKKIRQEAFRLETIEELPNVDV